MRLSKKKANMVSKKRESNRDWGKVRKIVCTGYYYLDIVAVPFIP